MPDDVIGYRLRPGQSVVFTTPEFSTAIRPTRRACATRHRPKPPGERRVVVLGDSLVLACQVPREQTVLRPPRGPAQRRRAGGVRYRVINAGVQGYGPVEELLFYRRVASHFDADLVLVATFVANDAVEAFDAAWRLDGSRPPAVGRGDETERTLRRTVRRSMVLQIARQRLDQLRIAAARRRRAEPAGGELPGDAAAVHHRRARSWRPARSARCHARSGRRRPPGDRADAGALPARSGRVRARLRPRPSRGRAESRRTSRPSASRPRWRRSACPRSICCRRCGRRRTARFFAGTVHSHRRRPRDGGARARGVHPARAPLEPAAGS
jgi:hypothetical protein